MNRAVGTAGTADAIPAVQPAARSEQVSFSALDAWALILPAVSFIEITVVGRLIVSEILFVAMLPWLWGARDQLPLPRWFVVLWAGWLLAQIVTDLVVGSVFQDFARGWASIFFTFTNFAAILVLVSTPRRARLFAVGLAVGGVLGYFFVPNLYAAGDPWKWAFALPVGLTLAVGLSGSFGGRHRLLTVSAFLAYGVANLLLGYRSLGGVSLLAAGYFILSATAGGQQAKSKPSMLRAAGGLVFLTAAVVGVLQLYDVAASQGLLGSTAQAKYLQQSGSLGVLLGGRSEVLASSQAIIDSPILGHGSWAKDPKYADLLAERRSSLGYEVGATPSDIGLIPAHSYLLGSWVWAGLMGGVFWVAIVGIAIWLLANLYSFRVDVAPLLVFSTMLLVWNIAFSPYGFNARIEAPFGIALCLLGLSLVRGNQATDRLDRFIRGTAPSRPGTPEGGERIARNLRPAPNGPGQTR